MAIAAPPKPQHLLALERANEVRLARAKVKRSILSGRRKITSVILEPPHELDGMTLGELLCAQRRWGLARARKFLYSVQLTEGKRIGTLTDRQRRVLVEALEAKRAQSR